VEQFIDIDKRGTKFYYKDKAMTILHRLDGPAVEYTNGQKLWFSNDMLHRLNGPAIERQDGSKKWYINGVFIFTLDGSDELEDRMR
jgi:hypothetical protein